jgi:glycosyltransferase involved in cell wall biosynthesis
MVRTPIVGANAPTSGWNGIARMNVLFVHNNFPAQYRHLAQALARDPNFRVAAVGSFTARTIPGADLRRYALTEGGVSMTHPFARRFDLECRRAEQVLYALSSLSASGFTPDLIMAHPGWGETLPLRTIFPRARFVLYCEFFYSAKGQDVGFDMEFSDTGADGHVGLHLKNAATLLGLSECDAGISPTAWQRSTYPVDFQKKIEVIHEGVDTDFFKPAPAATFLLDSGRRLRREEEIVTFVARNLEPLRGYHSFMRALPRILHKRPNAEILVIGDHGTSYGRLPPDGATWKSIFFEEIAARVDLSRIHFTGRLARADYLSALQVSSAHVYLTYPFVLSWSVLEAMSAGCLVIGSDTAPVREVIDGENGLLAPFFDTDALSARVIDALEHRARFSAMRAHARRSVIERFDLSRVCLPQMQAFLGVSSPRSAPVRSRAKRVVAGKSSAQARRIDSAPQPP